MAINTGINAQLKIGTASASTVVQNIVELTFPKSAGEIDSTSRTGSGWAGVRPGIRKWNISLTVLKDVAEGTWTTMRSAYLNGTKLYIEAKSSASTSGFSGVVYVLGFEDGEPTDGMQTTSISMAGDGALALA